MTWLDWLTTHVTWEWIAGAAVLTASVINLITSHYGDAHPRLAKALLFLVDLLSIVVSRGSTAGPGRLGGMSALKLPIVQTSPTSVSATRIKTRAGTVIERVGIVFCALLVGCSWQSATRSSLDAVSAIATYAPRAVELRCNAAKDKCIADKDRVCDPLRVCTDDLRTVAKVNVAVQGAVQVGLSAIKVGDKPGAEALLAEALVLVGPVKAMLAAYGVVIP